MKPEWGHKHICTNCDAHFYDMRKPEPSCPKCGTPAGQDKTPLAAPPEDTPPQQKKEADPLDDFDLEVTPPLDDENNDFLEDTSDLGDDENDMSEVIEHMDEGVVDSNL